MSDVPPTNLAQLREQRGLSVEALAAALRVSPVKIVALESGRYTELPNAAFTRALAISICRMLKADPVAILATLPLPNPINVLTEVSYQLPFKSGHARLNLDTSFLVQARQFFRLRYLLPCFILVAACAVYFWPKQIEMVAKKEDEGATPTPKFVLPNKVQLPPSTSPATSSAASLNTQGLPLVTPASGDAHKSGQGRLTLKANEDAWVEIKDAVGKPLLRGTVLAGESMALSGVLPLKIKVGNASALSLSYQGQAIDLTQHTRANVARLELK